MRFKERYNKFFDDNQNIIDEMKTKEEISKHIEHLYEFLWISIDLKYIINFFFINNLIYIF